MKKTLTLLMALMLGCISAYSVPAKPGVKRIVTLADGSQVELTLRGDEHYSYYTTEDGTPYQLKADGQLLKMTREEVSERWTALRNKHLANTRRANANMKSPRRVGSANVTTGKHRGLVILVEFSDVKFASADPQATYNRFFNEEGYHEYGNAGSVRDFFLKQSYGQLEIDFDVVGPYTTGGKLASYGAVAGEGNNKVNDVNPTAMVMEGIDQAAKDVDFSNYDWNNDGEVDQIFLICAGYSQAQGADGDYIWPHEWVLEAQGIERTYNGKKLNTYGVSTELWGNGINQNLDKTIDGIGTACHEFSHCLGLPDFYDTDYNGGFGMNIWSVMDYGSYLDNSHTPSGYTSYERWFSGWMEPTELKEMTTITGMKPLATTPEAYVLYNEGNKNEYYLLENRQPIDFDAKLPGHGMLVLHVDYNEGSWGSNVVNTDPNHQCMTIIPADGKLSSSTLKGDPFPGTSGATELTNYGRFTTSSIAEVYNKNSDGSLFMNKPIDNITESEDGLISFVACRPELGTPEPDNGTAVGDEASFTITWPAITGAVKYELEVTEMGMAATTPEDALQTSTDFAKFKTKSLGFTDVSGKMNEYGLSSWGGIKLFTSPDGMRIGTSTAVGYLKTPNWYMTNSTELTAVYGVNVVKQGTTVKGKVVFNAFNTGEYGQDTEEKAFEISGKTKLVFNFSSRKEGFWLEFRPEAQVSLDYFALYDGTWTAEQLGIGTSAARTTARRASTVKNYTTETNSITLKDQNKGSRYIYKVRAIGQAGDFSGWSKECEFQFSNADGIVNIISRQKEDVIYDLQGHRRDSNPASLPKGIYIIGGKKVVK